MSSEFCTKTRMIERKNFMPNQFWGIALDVGYSAVKGMSPNAVYSFPSFAKPSDGKLMDLGEASPDEIQFMDNDGTLWDVGAAAQSRVKSSDTNDSSQSLFGRNRYYNPMFRVIALTGIGMGMLDNEYGKPGSRKVVIQTGLPPAFLIDDAMSIKDVLKGKHDFRIKVGNREWKRIKFELTEDDIKVMAQPMGSLLSAAMNNDANLIPDAKSYLTSRVLVFDGGFGTLDLFPVISRKIEPAETKTNLGMKAVFEDIIATFQKKYNTTVSMTALQRHLSDGFIPVVNRAKRKTFNIDITDIVRESNAKICQNAMNEVSDIFDYLKDFDYLLVTGGTGAAWYDMIVDNFKDMINLHVISGNQNDNLSHIYSNVRGYYMFQANKLREREKMTNGQKKN